MLLTSLLRSPLRPVLQLERPRAFNPRAVVAVAADSFWRTPADMSSSYQDSAGTTPVTAVEQPVGRALDVSGRANHAIQATAAARPVLSARVNGLIDTETFASWPKTDTTPSTVPGASPTGGSAVLMTEGSATNAALTSPVAALAGSSHRMRIALRRGNTDWLRVRFLDSAGSNGIQGWLNTATGAKGTTQNQGTGTGSFSIVALDANWLVVSADVATGSANNLMQVISAAGDASSARVAGATYYVWGADLRSASDAALNLPPYQRVSTSSDYDTAGFPAYDRLDGVDDSLSAASGGGGSSGFFYCAAVTVLGGAGTIRSLWSDRGTNTGYQVRLNASDRAEIIGGNGTTYIGIGTAATFGVGETHIVTAWDDGSNVNVQIDNGVVASNSRPAMVGGTAGFVEGNQAGQFFPGRLGSRVYVKDSGLDATLREQIKRALAVRAGVSL